MMEFLVNGGVFAYTAVLLGFFTLIVCVAQLFAALVRTRFDLTGIAIGAIGVTLGIGFLGLLVNLQEAVAAVAATTPAQKTTLLMKACALSLHPLVVACIFTALAAAIAGVAATVRANRAPEEAAS